MLYLSILYNIWIFFWKKIIYLIEGWFYLSFPFIVGMLGNSCLLLMHFWLWKSVDLLNQVKINIQLKIVLKKKILFFISTKYLKNREFENSHLLVFHFDNQITSIFSTPETIMVNFFYSRVISLKFAPIFG